MNATTPQIGHNGAPDPIDEALAPFGGDISEAENWLDGELVQNEGQMKAVDALIKQIKSAEKSVGAAEESEAKPIYDEWKAAKARYKPTLDDLARIRKGLLALVDDFKRKLAAEKAEAERAARAEAEAAMRAAQEAASAANAADIEAQRKADEAQREADEAQRRAAAASKDTVKGLRSYDVTEIISGTEYARWLWVNDREPLLEWMEGYARRCKHHIPGVVETRTEKRAV